MFKEADIDKIEPNWLDEIYYFIRWEIIDPIIEFPKEVKYFIQRGIRGYSDRDLWCLSNYVTSVILSGVKVIAQETTAYPATINTETNKLEFDQKRWKEVLNRIVEGFELMRRCLEGTDLEFGGYLRDDEYGTREEKKERLNSIFKSMRFTTNEEEKKIEEAFNLFRDNFFALYS